MGLVRYGTNVFEIDDVYGLDLHRKKKNKWRLKVVIHGGTQSFDIYFDDEDEARQAFETICGELDIRELTPRGGELAEVEEEQEEDEYQEEDGEDYAPLGSEDSAAGGFATD